ncbi:MAG: type II secretion system protein GspK [Gammaproteobacteria bacterium]|nr:type II secretion system protein GspK [Gammaproteobacteria bacterium]
MTKREGFILAATLWALVALTVIAAYIDGVTRTNVDNAHRAKRMLQAELDRRGTEATLLYLLATNRMNRRSLVLETEQRPNTGTVMLDDTGDGVLRLGGEAYQGLGEVAFSLQDELGLVSVNAPTYPQLSQVLTSIGVPGGDVAALMPRLSDYIDVDGDLILDGAEAYDYARTDRPPPANFFLATPMELNRVLGAENLLDRAQRQRLRAMTTPRLVSGLNFNTMPPEVAAAVLETEIDDLDAFLAAREEAPLTDFDRILELTGRAADIPSERVAPAPSIALRVSTWWQHGGPRTVVGITLSPAARYQPPVSAPWRKEYRYSEPSRPATALRQAPTPLLGGQAEDQDATAAPPNAPNQRTPGRPG